MINIIWQLRVVNDTDFEDKQYTFDFEQIYFRNFKNRFGKIYNRVTNYKGSLLLTTMFC
jgi:5-methylcytosine-specific restriction endonuclease McrBC GTP-binding regulatory subunit McrB